MKKTNLKRSRKRAMDAMCQECSGFEYMHNDCRSTICPLYPFRKNRELEPDYWWTAPKALWKRKHKEAWKYCRDKWMNYFISAK